LGVLYAAEKNKKIIGAVREFFKHYIIARQLNDDAHDWEEDMEKGHINSVGALIVKKWIASSSRHHLERGINLRNKKALQHLLWDGEVIDEVCREIEEHTEKARASLLATGIDHNAAKELLA